MTRLFDTHAHIQEFADAEAVVARARTAGVTNIAVCGYDQQTNAGALALAALHKGLYPAVGFHPHEARDVAPQLLAELASQAALPEVVAVGEIGLDFYRNLSPREDQERILSAQLAIALDLGKPILVHSRAAEADAFGQLEPHAAAFNSRGGARLPGVMHCFGGTVAQAQRYAALGYLVSIACSITYPPNAEARRIAAELPLESLVVETDSPYLPPQRIRGKRNEPANVVEAARAIASVRAVSLESVAAATFDNAARLFNVQAAVGALPA